MKKYLFLLSIVFFFACKGKEKGPSDPTTANDTKLEKTSLKLGFIKLTDMAPLAIAKELGYFEKEGLDVTLEAQSNWKILLDRVITGELDGAHMLAGQPIGATIGFGTKADIVTAFSMDLNGNAITVSNEVWALMKKNLKIENGKVVHPITADALKSVVESFNNNGKQFKMGMVFPVSTHNYELRYWLAAGGLNPGMYTENDATGTTGATVLLSVTPPPQMPATLQAGTINGYCVGEPWNQQAVFKNIGVPVVTNYDIWKNCPEKVFGVTKDWAQKNPNTHIAIVKALIKAGKWLDDPKNREEAARIISKPEYVGADYQVIANSMTGTFEFEKGDKRSMPDFNVFFKHNATYPFYSDAIWFMTQMRRWGQINETKPDSWYKEQAEKIYLPEVWKKAAESLKKEGIVTDADIPTTDGYKPATNEFIDQKTYDGKKPNEYLKQFTIGNKN
ncbi:MAG: CmpA/NrtA family ABC transporter substrate-binding protein [Bacteroidota bacterium]